MQLIEYKWVYIEYPISNNALIVHFINKMQQFISKYIRSIIIILVSLASQHSFIYLLIYIDFFFLLLINLS